MAIQFEGKIKLEGSNENLLKVQKLLEEEKEKRHDDKFYPGIWLQWIIRNNDEGFFIEWNGGEKFYNGAEWIDWIIINLLKPNKIQSNGKIFIIEHYARDTGVIFVKENKSKFISLEEFSEVLT